MSGRILGVELRRSAAWRTAVIIGFLGAAMYYVGANQGGGWAGLALQQRAMVGALMALAVAAGAWQAARERRSTMDELIGTTPLPRWRRVLPTAVAMALAAVAGYLLMYLLGAAHLVPVATYFPAGSIATAAVGALAVAAAVLVGLAVGARFPSPLTPPLLGVASVAVVFAFPAFVLGTRHGLAPKGTVLLSPTLQVTNGLTPEFVTVSASTSLAQALWLGGVAVAGLTLFAASRLRGRLAAVVPATVGLLAALPLLPPTLADAFVIDEGATGQVCTADPPTVCTTRVHSAALADLTGPGRRALTILAERLPDAPTSIVEDFANPISADPARQRPDEILAEIRVDADGRAYHSPDVNLWYFLAGAGTQVCSRFISGVPDESRKAYLSARLAVELWLIGDAPPAGTNQIEVRGGDPTLARDTVDRLRARPVGEQRERVAAFRRAELTCAPGDRLDLLTGQS